MEPSIGIISGCLPTLRPLTIYFSKAFLSRITSTRKSSQYTESPAHSLNPLETISKKRTRKIATDSDLEHTYVDDDESDTKVRTNRKSWAKARRTHEQTGNWRPDEDEMCLTTTTVHCSDKDGGNVDFESSSRDGREDGGITMTTEFDWDEERRRSREADE